jgi:putative solute:sodium symporter small subunit
MQNASTSLAVLATKTAPILLLEQHFGVRRLKRGMLAMLAAWLGYFAVISMWGPALNKVTVPLLDVPLGVFLIAQGTAVIFIAALVLLARNSGTAGATR